MSTESPDRLFDLAAIPASSCRELVELDPSSCPECSSPVDYVEWREAALLVHGGYGADRVIRFRLCRASDCSFELVESVGDGRPSSPPAWARRFETVTPAPRFL